MKIGITFSTFDLFHAGHVLMLKEAKEIHSNTITAKDLLEVNIS